MRTITLVFPILLAGLLSCRPMKKEVDLIVANGVIYTMNDTCPVAEAFAVKDHRIAAVGNRREIINKYRSDHVIDLNGRFVYPGWIDAHCHFHGYSLTLGEAALAGSSSPEEIIALITEHHRKYPATWLTGRGWDQNDWEVKEFPDKAMLDAHFRDIPVMLRRIDGHAAWVNSKALEMAGITSSTRVEGGDVIIKNGEPSGILIDNAIDLVGSLVPSADSSDVVNALLRAEENCFSVGLTSLHDAGLGSDIIEIIDALQKEGRLKMRINAMLSPSEENIRKYVEKGPVQNDYLTIGTIKLYADGALGSRGALLTEPYTDDPGNRGLRLTPEEDLIRYCKKAFEKNFQVATHCIGDEGNRMMLKIYSDILGGRNDRRWRIEHAQIIHPEDIPLFGIFNIVPSVQPTHATSDMYWAEERLGRERMAGAYAYKELLGQNGWIPAGSDFPVEDINPLYGFYAAVARKDFEGYPEKGFLPENALSREEALKSMTIWAAMAAFEENLKGSIEPGKLADFVITEKDIMAVPEEEIFKVRVTETYSGGEQVYRKGE